MRSGSCNNPVLTNGNSQTKSLLCSFLCLSPAMWSGGLSRIMLAQAILVCTERRKGWRMSRFPKDTPSHLYKVWTMHVLQGMMTALASEEAAVLISRIHKSKGFQHTQPLLPQFPLFLPQPVLSQFAQSWQCIQCRLTERSFGAGYNQKKPQKMIFAFQGAKNCSLKKSKSPWKLLTKENLPTVIHPWSVRAAWN